MKPRWFVCLYNFYVGKPLLELGKVARGTRTYAIRPFDDVPQYLGGVVRRVVRVAQLSRIYRSRVDPNKFAVVVPSIHYGFSV